MLEFIKFPMSSLENYSSTLSTFLLASIFVLEGILETSMESKAMASNSSSEPALFFECSSYWSMLSMLPSLLFKLELKLDAVTLG
jgi:hypothetical protein